MADEKNEMESSQGTNSPELGQTAPNIETTSQNIPSPSGQFYYEPFQISRWWSQVVDKFSTAIASGFHPKSIGLCVTGLILQAYLLKWWFLICRSFDNSILGTTLIRQESFLPVDDFFYSVPALSGFYQTAVIWWQLTNPMRYSLVGMTQSSSAWFLLVLTFVLLGMWSWIGTGITRRVALKWADRTSQESPLRFSNRNFLRSWCGLAIPLAICLMVAIPLIFIGRLCSNWSIIAGGYWLVVSPILLLCGFLLVVVTFTGFLFPAAVGVDRSDAFETISRCFSYFLARPFQFILLTVISFLALGVIGGITGQIFYCSQWMIEQGSLLEFRVTSAPALDDLIRSQNDSNSVFYLLSPGIEFHLLPFSILSLIGKAIQLSLMFSVSTAAYLMLRKSKDETPLDKIYLEGKGMLQDLNEIKN